MEYYRNDLIGLRTKLRYCRPVQKGFIFQWKSTHFWKICRCTVYAWQNYHLKVFLLHFTQHNMVYTLSICFLLLQDYVWHHTTCYYHYGTMPLAWSAHMCWAMVACSIAMQDIVITLAMNITCYKSHIIINDGGKGWEWDYTNTLYSPED